MPRRHRKMKKGGFLGFGDSSSTTSGSSMFGSLGSTLSGWGSTVSQDTSNLGSSLSQGVSGLWNKTKNATSGLTSSYGSTPVPTTYGTPMGGRKRTKRHMRGGNFKDNTPTTGLAAHAFPISGVKTAQPHNLVGGRTKKHHKHRHSKSRRHRKH